MSEPERAVRANLAEGQRRALRLQALAVSIALLCELLLGMALNLDASIPAADRGAGIVPAIGRAVSQGPAALGVHAILGLLLVVGSLAAAVAGVTSRSPALAIPAVVALVCMACASVSGASFVGSQRAGASMAMAACTAVALGCYAIVLFVLARPGESAGGDGARRARRRIAPAVRVTRATAQSASTEHRPLTGGS
jgi:hypothetical protein